MYQLSIAVDVMTIHEYENIQAALLNTNRNEIKYYADCLTETFNKASMHHLGHQEKAALLLAADDDHDDEETHHDMTTSSSTHTNDRFPVVTKRPRTYHRHRSATSQPILF
ncbi:unnamed protein product [Adineta ricciae]|uniref:Uncharacterized protein n=1 Tax=Adineta ricciae TaxID=249248 RepID=A0A815BX77_ADIRI|nr:unnamed protein product [Adineta ricciae]